MVFGIVAVAPVKMAMAPLLPGLLRDAVLASVVVGVGAGVVLTARDALIGSKRK
jgi:hypothetical protein